MNDGIDDLGLIALAVLIGIVVVLGAVTWFWRIAP